MLQKPRFIYYGVPLTIEQIEHMGGFPSWNHFFRLVGNNRIDDESTIQLFYLNISIYFHSWIATVGYLKMYRWLMIGGGIEPNH
jgi:hypothetical protein